MTHASITIVGFALVTGAMGVASCQVSPVGAAEAADRPVGVQVEIEHVKDNSFPPSWLSELSYVYARLQKDQLDDSCYEVSFWTEDTQRFVSVGPKLITVKTGEDDFRFVHPEGCGDGQTFGFDGGGKFIGMVKYRD